MSSKRSEEEGRSRLLSEKGLGYQRDMKMKKRKKILDLMNRQSVDLNRLLSESTDHLVVKNNYSDWLSTYEELLMTQEECLLLLDSEEIEEEKMWFDRIEKKFRDLKGLSEHWFLTNPTCYKDDVRSTCSKRSSVGSRASSQITLERLKESQNKAELLARASALAEKQKLEEDKLKLKMKEEELEIRTELQVSDAKTKALELLERSLLQNEEDLKDLQENQSITQSIGNYAISAPSENERTSFEDKHPLHTDRPEVQFIDPNYEITKPALNRNDRQCDERNISLMVSRELNKPKSEIVKFDGNPLDYNRFLRQFNSRVCANTDSYEEKLNFLLQFTCGEANRIVAGYSNLNSEKGYKAAMEEFTCRYGDSNIIAQAYVKKALNWPVVKADDPKALDDLYIFLRECLFAVGNSNASSVLEYPDNLKVIVKKLPFYLHEKWRNVVFDIKSKNKQITFENLVTFIRKEAMKAMDPVFGKTVMSTGTSSKPAPNPKTSNQFKGNKSFITATSENRLEPKLGIALREPCLFCQGHHALNSCNNIIKEEIKERYSFLRTKGLCYGCLRSGHLKGICKNKAKCSICNGLHLTILHIQRSEEGNNNTSANVKTTATHMGAGDQTAQALPIVPVRVKAKSSDKYFETYAFLDSGSTASFCSERLIRALNLEGRKTKINLTTMGMEGTCSTYKLSDLEISSLDGGNTLDLPAVFSQKTLPISERDVILPENLHCWPYLMNIPLNRIHSTVDLLIGVNVPKAMEPWEVIPSQKGGPYAVKTMFGWVINGPIEIGSDNSRITSNFIKVEPTLQDQIINQFNHDFSERSIDDIPENSREDKMFLEVASNSIRKSENGHYSVDLPFKSRPCSMPNNRKQAEQRLIMLAKRFKKDIDFQCQYKEFMEKVIKKGYAQRVTLNDEPLPGKVWYLPHHGVYHPKKNKIRVVFDCAAKYQGTSLNDKLLQGPNLTNTLVGTLIRFRQESIAFCGDIESMFYQVEVSEKDRNFQRFLWWENGDVNKQPIEYKMNVHLFGSTSSPSCANYVLRKAATDQRGKFSEETINTVLKNFYVDDCLKSVPTVKGATSLVEDLHAVLEDGGFHITKWISNSRELVGEIPVEERASDLKNMDLDNDRLPIERTLGVNWCTEGDKFCFTVDIKKQPFTRRGILSCISSIYDPLGFIAPLLLRAKVILQKLCQLQLGWDDRIPDNFASKWCEWLQDIQNVSSYQVERCYKPPGFGTVKSAELHHFADASEMGYGIVTYLRLKNTEGTAHCSFVIGKSRVAPLKKVTIPRLELTAATIAVKTDKAIKREIDITIDRSYFWTDSMTVLRYIKNNTSRFHTFVANRLTIIHEGSEPEQWHYVNTKQNPADIASRGLAVDKNVWTNQWIEAPQMLWENKEAWPESSFEETDIPEEDPEVKIFSASSLVHECGPEKSNSPTQRLMSYHSSWNELKRSVAWLLKIRTELWKRVDRKRKHPQGVIGEKTSNNLTAENMREAEKAILQFIQSESFNDELKDLQKSESKVKRNSSLRKLDPVIRNGLICVGERLSNANIPVENKHPVVLPRDHNVSVLILRDLHNNLMHSGRNHMLAHLRQRYWLIKAPSAIRKVLSKCVTCRRQKAHVGEQKMSNLPHDRVVTDEPPFTRVGVDYFGPIEVKLKRSRVKRWGVIFTCLASRAVHLELAYSLDTDSYIHALRRFIARRGNVKKIISDNGTNFVGAERVLKESIAEWNTTAIGNAMVQRDIDWNFNPPAGSHFGGVWERLIKSVRYAMNCTVREQVLDDEGLSTLMCEIEAILNSRPITWTSNQCDDVLPLTPNHLLTLKNWTNLPPGVFDKSDNYCRRRWRQIQFMANLFWKRWVREYLPLLQERQKWHFQRRNIQVGDVVIIVDSNAPRNSWPSAVVIETLPDRAGLVRQAKVRTATNILTRPIDKLVVTLEME